MIENFNSDIDDNNNIHELSFPKQLPNTITTFKLLF